MSENVRDWIIEKVTGLLPSDTSEIRSDTNGVLFKEWTDMTQSALESIWIAEDTQRAINNIAAGKGEDLSLLRYQQRARAIMDRAKYMIEYRQKEYAEAGQLMSGTIDFKLSSMVKNVGVTTTCNAFLGVVVRKALTEGGLARRYFHSFDLPVAGGTAWNWYPTPGKSPKAGDFFQIGKRGGMYQHVGIIIDINGEQMTTADSGQGGPSVGYDAIKRKKRSVSDIMGWIDVDVFFENWKGASARAAAATQ